MWMDDNTKKPALYLPDIWPQDKGPQERTSIDTWLAQKNDTSVLNPLDLPV